MASYIFIPIICEAVEKRKVREYSVTIYWGFAQTVLKVFSLKSVVISLRIMLNSEGLGVMAASSIIGNIQAVYVMAMIDSLATATVIVGQSIGAGNL